MARHSRKRKVVCMHAIYIHIYTYMGVACCIELYTLVLSRPCLADTGTRGNNLSSHGGQQRNNRQCNVIRRSRPLHTARRPPLRHSLLQHGSAGCVHVRPTGLLIDVYTEAVHACNYSAYTRAATVVA